MKLPDQADIYLAGPMRGYPELNFPAFHEAARHLRGLGFSVINPAELDRTDPVAIPFGMSLDEGWPLYLSRDIRYLDRCDSIAALPGWAKSQGARVEVFIAMTRGRPVMPYVPDITPPLQRYSTAELAHCLSPLTDPNNPLDGYPFFVRDDDEDPQEPECSCGCGYDPQCQGPQHFPPSEEIEVLPNGAKQSKLDYRMDLMPARATLAVAGVLAEGAAKYGEENWRGIPVRAHLNHALVHAEKWKLGDISEDHLGHFTCRALMALEIQLTNRERIADYAACQSQRKEITR